MNPEGTGAERRGKKMYMVTMKGKIVGASK
jgi:hypothetical protein